MTEDGKHLAEILGNPFNMPMGQDGQGEDVFVEALKDIMNSAAGRTVVWHLLEQTKMYNENYYGDARDYIEKGQRNIGHWLLGELETADPTIYPRMLLEVAKKAKRDQLKDQNNDQ